MPTVLLDRIPVPNLKLYTSLSLILLSSCIYYAIITTRDPFWRKNLHGFIDQDVIDGGVGGGGGGGVGVGDGGNSGSASGVFLPNVDVPNTDGSKNTVVNTNILDSVSTVYSRGSTIEHLVDDLSSLLNSNAYQQQKQQQQSQHQQQQRQPPPRQPHQQPQEQPQQQPQQQPPQQQQQQEPLNKPHLPEQPKKSGEPSDTKIQYEYNRPHLNQYRYQQYQQHQQEKNLTNSRTLYEQLIDIGTFMGHEPICIWTLINMAYCTLILLGKTIQRIVFGELRISEQQHMKDKFWNFIFYKFIFVFGVVNVQFLHEVILWVAWFSVIGFLQLLSQLCKDRFEYLSFSPTTPGWSHVRLITLLSTITAISGVMFIICIFVAFFNGFNTFAFMAAECILLSIRTIHILVRYGMFLYDMRHGAGTLTTEVIPWDKRGPVAYYIEFIFEAASLTIDFLHHVHMLIWSNIFLSMASLVILMQIRYITNEIQRRVKKHRNYVWVLNHMEKSYPLATPDELKQNSDNCAICWEKMEIARKLPCFHLFHNSCLQSWLEQDTSCPTCRLSLNVTNAMQPIDEPENVNNHFFHFNGARYASWLPSFSVEVTNINNVLRAHNPISQGNALPNHTSQLRTMARQVQHMFPRYTQSIIIADLRMTRSMEITIDNILEGRLQMPSSRFQNSIDNVDGDDVNFMNGIQNNNSNSNSISNSNSSSSSSGNSNNSNNISDNDVNLNSNDNINRFNNDHQYINDNNSSSMSSTSDSGYEIEKNSNIFGNQNELLRDDSLEDVSLGDRFSKSSYEREKILQKRKEMLLSVVRRRYIEKNKSDLNINNNNEQQQQQQLIRHRNSLEAD